MDLIRKKNSRYGGRYKVGDPMQASTRQAKVLVALGEADYAKPKAKRTKGGTYARRDMVAQNPMVEEPVTALPQQEPTPDA